MGIGGSGRIRAGARSCIRASTVAATNQPSRNATLSAVLILPMEGIQLEHSLRAPSFCAFSDSMPIAYSLLPLHFAVIL